MLPNLRILDDELTLNTKSLSPRKESRKRDEHLQQQCPFDDDWNLINQILDEGLGPPEDNLAINESVRPGTASSSQRSMSNASVRPLSSMRPLSSYRIRTALKDRPRSGASRDNLHSSSSATGLISVLSGSSHSRPSTDPLGDINNDASYLTVGPALQGNPLKALLARKSQNRPATPNKTLINSQIDNSEFDTFDNKKKPNYKNAIESLEKNKEADDIKLQNKELKDEIMKWRKDHAK
jgi:hypothetical protein